MSQETILLLTYFPPDGELHSRSRRYSKNPDSVISFTPHFGVWAVDAVERLTRKQLTRGCGVRYCCTDMNKLWFSTSGSEAVLRWRIRYVWKQRLLSHLNILARCCIILGQFHLKCPHVGDHRAAIHPAWLLWLQWHGISLTLKP